MNPADYFSVILTAAGKNRAYYQSAFYYLAANPRLIEYIGISERGALTSESKWIVAKFVYTNNNMVSTIQTSLENQILDDRATLTYA